MGLLKIYAGAAWIMRRFSPSSRNNLAADMPANSVRRHAVKKIVIVSSQRLGDHSLTGLLNALFPELKIYICSPTIDGLEAKALESSSEFSTTNAREGRDVKSLDRR